MAISLNYRNLKSKETHVTVQWLKNTKKCTFGFKVGLNRLNERPSVIVQEDDMGAAVCNLIMIGNSTSISHVFANRVTKKYDLVYSQRAFVHWYVGECMEECKFAEARFRIS